MNTRQRKYRRPAFEDLEGRALLSAGTLDTSFGGTGEVVTTLGVPFKEEGLAVQPDLKTVVVGYEELGNGNPTTEFPVVAIRYNIDGSLDSSFGIRGIAQIPNASAGFGPAGTADCVAIQANGDIVVATNAKTYNPSTGAVTSANMLVARLLSNGQLDSTFGSGGEAHITLPTGNDCAVGVAVLPTGQIVVAGTVQGLLVGPTYTVARLTSSGALDTTFGPNGQGYNDVAVMPVTNPITAATAYLLAVDPTGDLLLGGTWVNSAQVRTGRVVRYTPNGLLDPSFGSQGVLDLAGIAGVYDIAFTPGGQILVADGRVVALDPDGTTATGFGSGGSFTDPNADLLKLAVQSDGKILALGTNSPTAPVQNQVDRILPNGTLDPSFGANGDSVVFSGSSTVPGGMVLGPDGKITGMVSGGPSLFRLLNDISTPTTGQVAVTQQPPASLTAGTHFSLTVQVDDSSGNLESSYNGTLTVSVAGGPGGLVGTLTATASGGVATFNDLTLTGAGSDTLLVSGDSLASATSTAISVSPAAPAHVVVIQQPPSSVTAGSPFGLTAAIEDAYGNIVTGATGTVTVALATGPAGAMLGGTLSASTSSGVATFSGLTLTQATSGYTLSVSTSGLAVGTTGAFTVTPAAATQLVIVQQPPSNVRVNRAFTVVVAIEDAYGNVVTNAKNSVSVAFGNNPTRAKLGGTRKVTAKNGYVTFSNLTVSKAGSGYTLVFSNSGLSSVKTSAFSAS